MVVRLNINYGYLLTIIAAFVCIYLKMVFSDEPQIPNAEVVGEGEEEGNEEGIDICKDHIKETPTSVIKTLEFNLQCRYLNNSAIEILWKEPPINETDNFCGYVITWAPITTKNRVETHVFRELDPTKTSHVVTDLKYDLPYWFLVKMSLNGGTMVKESADFHIGSRWFEHDEHNGHNILPHDPPIHSLTTFSITIITLITVSVVIVCIIAIIKLFLERNGSPYIFNRSPFVNGPSFKIGSSLQSIFRKRGRDDNVNFSTLVDQSEGELTRV